MTWHPKRAQLICRDVRHSWQPSDAWREGHGFVRRLVCNRCFATKTQTLDSEGYVLSTSMSYREGYLRKGEGRTTADEKAQLRLENLGRLDSVNGENRE